MKLTKRQLRRIIREAIRNYPDELRDEQEDAAHYEQMDDPEFQHEADYTSKLLDMARSSFARFQQAKELAFSMGLDINLDLELLKIIKQELKTMVLSIKERERGYFTVDSLVNFAVSIDFSSNDEGGGADFYEMGRATLGDDAIIWKWSNPNIVMIDNKRRVGSHEFDSVDKLVRYLSDNIN